MGQGLPKRIAEQGKRAEELIKKLQAGQDPSAVQPAVNTPPAPAPLESPVTPPVVQPAVTPDPPATPAPVTPETPATPPAPVTPSPAACPECAKWQQKFSVLQGKYDAEVPRYAYRVQYLENQIEDLNGQIYALRSATPAVPAATPPGASPLATTTTFLADALKDNPEFKGFKENFPDIADMVFKMVDTAATKIHQETAQRFTALEGNSVQDRQTKFATALNAKHPAWQTMGGDPNWAVWLGQKDRYSPKRRLDLLKEANQSSDAEAVANLLDDFKADMAKAGISNQLTPAPPTPPAVPFVTPPSGPGSAPANLNANQGPETVTRSFINQFYQDKVRGRYKGREEEVAKIQSKIDAAIQSGRVINK